MSDGTVQNRSFGVSGDKVCAPLPSGVRIVQPSQLIDWCDAGTNEQPKAVFTLGDARSFSGLTSKISPLGSMLFDADVKETILRVTNVKTPEQRPNTCCVAGPLLFGSLANTDFTTNKNTCQC